MITLKLTDQQADQVLNALALRPFIEVQGIINELAKQLQAQKQPEAGTAIPGGAVAVNGSGASPVQ